MNPFWFHPHSIYNPCLKWFPRLRSCHPRELSMSLGFAKRLNAETMLDFFHWVGWACWQVLTRRRDSTKRTICQSHHDCTLPDRHNNVCSKMWIPNKDHTAKMPKWTIEVRIARKRFYTTFKSNNTQCKPGPFRTLLYNVNETIKNCDYDIRTCSHPQVPWFSHLACCNPQTYFLVMLSYHTELAFWGVLFPVVHVKMNLQLHYVVLNSWIHPPTETLQVFCACYMSNVFKPKNAV